MTDSAAIGRKRGLFLLSIMFALLVVITFTGDASLHVTGFLTTVPAVSAEDCDELDELTCENTQGCVVFAGICLFDDEDGDGEEADGVASFEDNCPFVNNPNQVNIDVTGESALGFPLVGEGLDESNEWGNNGFGGGCPEGASAACADDVRSHQPTSGCSFNFNAHAFREADGSELNLDSESPDYYTSTHYG